MYGDAIQTAIHFAMDKEFGPTIKAQMLHYNGPNADQMSEVNQKMDDVKNVMVQNIEMVLERGEKLELLVDKTEQLQRSVTNQPANQSTNTCSPTHLPTHPPQLGRHI